jgi:hypothetical protein
VILRSDSLVLTSLCTPQVEKGAGQARTGALGGLTRSRDSRPLHSRRKVVLGVCRCTGGSRRKFLPWVHRMRLVSGLRPLLPVGLPDRLIAPIRSAHSRDWPRYMESRELRSGLTAYYWKPPTWARRQGCCMPARPLGHDCEVAKHRCNTDLNVEFDLWRARRDNGSQYFRRFPPPAHLARHQVCRVPLGLAMG